MTQQTAWPEGVTARYLTIGGATVDLRPGQAVTGARAICGGCNESTTRGTNLTREWAQAHAEKCRALPKPAAA